MDEDPIRFEVRNPHSRHPTLTSVAWERQFGRGYTLVFAAIFVIAIVTFGVGFFTERFRWMGLSLAAVGGGFAFAVLYQTVWGIGIPINMTILRPREQPIRFWSVFAITMTLALLMAIVGIWGFLYPDRMTAFVEQHVPAR